MMRLCNNNIVIECDWRVCTLFDFREKITSFSCFFGSGLNYILHWYARFLVISKSEFRVFWEFLVSMIFEKIQVSSATILHIDIIPSGKSFIYIKNKRGPYTDPRGTPEFAFLHTEFWQFKTTLCFWSLR